MKDLPNIFLIGFMGCGKSTIAANLQRRYGMQLIEMDQMIAEEQNMSIPEMFEKYGESYFRDLEYALLRDIQYGKNQVVSCGGGAVLRTENVIAMKKSGIIVLLKANPATILKRVQGNDDRPILKGKKTIADIAALMEARREKYEAAADIVVVTDNNNIDDICEEIIGKIKGEKIC